MSTLKWLLTLIWSIDLSKTSCRGQNQVRILPPKVFHKIKGNLFWKWFIVMMSHHYLRAKTHQIGILRQFFWIIMKLLLKRIYRRRFLVMHRKALDLQDEILNLVELWRPESLNKAIQFHSAISFSSRANTKLARKNPDTKTIARCKVQEMSVV